MDDFVAQVLEAWWTNQRIHELLIDAISDEGLACTLSKRGGRNVVRQFAHLHNVRLWHLQKRRAQDLAEGLHLFETAEEPDREALKKHLQTSAQALATFFEQSAAGTHNRRGFKKGLVPFLSYFIAHESHHRGNILLTLKQSGHNLDKAIRYKIWDWDRL